MWSSDRPRMPAGWSRTRRNVLNDSSVCYLCGQPGADQVDHVLPRSRGGGDYLNLQPVHRDCHAKKSSAEGNNRRAELRARRLRPSDRHPGAC